VPADAPGREITRRKWLTRRIRYPPEAHFLRISRILRVNPPARPAAGTAGTGVTGPGGNGRRPGKGSEPDRRLNGQTARSAHVFAFDTHRFPLGFDPRRGRDLVVAPAATSVPRRGPADPRGPEHPLSGVKRPALMKGAGRAVTGGDSFPSGRGQRPVAASIARRRDQVAFPVPDPSLSRGLRSAPAMMTEQTGAA
jgi:hypothetical protein